MSRFFLAAAFTPWPFAFTRRFGGNPGGERAVAFARERGFRAAGNVESELPTSNTTSLTFPESWTSISNEALQCLFAFGSPEHRAQKCMRFCA